MEILVLSFMDQCLDKNGMVISVVWLLEAHIRHIDFSFMVVALPSDFMDNSVGCLSHETLGGIVCRRQTVEMDLLMGGASSLAVGGAFGNWVSGEAGLGALATGLFYNLGAQFGAAKSTWKKYFNDDLIDRKGRVSTLRRFHFV